MMERVKQALWRRKIRRSAQLVAARRFVKRMRNTSLPPGGLVMVPDSVKMKDIVFWMNRDLAATHPQFFRLPRA